MAANNFVTIPPSGSGLPRGATSFYDFSQNDDGGQPGSTDTQDDGGSGTPASSSLATPTLNGNSGSSSSSTSTGTTTAKSPYAQFKGSSFGDVYDYLRSQMEDFSAETDEEKEKREKREKRIGFLARLAEGLGSFHTAFSHARGIKAMDMPKMSAKSTELFEKAKAQREKERDRYVNYVTTLGRLKNMDRDFGFRVAKAEQDQENWQRKYDSDRADKAQRLEAEAKVADARAASYEAQGRHYEAQAERDKAQARRLEAQATYDEARAQWVGPQAQSVIDKNRAQGNAAQRNASANEQRAASSAKVDSAKAEYYNRGNRGVGKGSKGVYGTFLGTPYSTSADYNKAVKAAAYQYGVPTTTGFDGTPRQVSDIAADVEKKAKAKPNYDNVKKLGL